MRKAIALVTAGAVVLVAAAPADAQASPRRYCGTTADGFPGVMAVGPTTCGFARNAGTGFDSKRVPLIEGQPSM